MHAGLLYFTTIFLCSILICKLVFHGFLCQQPLSMCYIVHTTQRKLPISAEEKKERCSSKFAPSTLLAGQWVFVFFFSLLLLLFSLFASICIYVYFYACVTFLGACMSGKYAFCFLVLLFLWYSSSGVSHEQLVNHRLCDFFYLPFGFFGDAQFEIKAYLLDKSCRKFFKTLVWKKDCIFSLNTEYKMKSRRDGTWFVIGLFCCWEILGKCKICETYGLLLALIWTAKCWVNVSFISYKVEDVRF